MSHIDINADLGEGGPADAELMAIVSSCNIACGGHAGDSESMAAVLMLAKEHGVAAGAHPSYPDREGFGRRAHFLNGSELRASLSKQVHDLAELSTEAGMKLRHLKPHGALYHDANNDPELAEMIAVLAAESGLTLVGPPEGELSAAAVSLGVGYVAEGFADRAYDVHGRLVPRGQPGAVFERPEQAVEQALSLALNRTTRSSSGEEVCLQVDTLCLHGDTPDAVALATAVRSALVNHGVAIRAVQV